MTPPTVQEMEIWIWPVGEIFIRGNRFSFRPSDVLHRKDQTEALQIVESDVVRIKFEWFHLRFGKYMSQGEFETSLECFVKFLKNGVFHG